ncbi:MAG TPA: helix-turn-helix domain-containing protein [Candidatus Cybelea sp.]|nr:helix-turn-helix domain-containing protein [Candidatus Cybelea sp.]
MEAPSANPPDFGALLRQHRIAAGLSQEALAERARMSADGISALERGHRRTPQRETLVLLAGALALDDEQRRAFALAANRSRLRRGAGSAAEPGRLNGALSNLPLSLTSFVGRERELAEIAALVREHRLVTLTGAGGIGKTQTALQAGTILHDELPDGVRFIALATLESPSLIVAAIASALGVKEVPSAPLLDTLLAFLKDRATLLIFDNCEHLVGEAANVAEAILAACPRVRILATSRESLRTAGERTYRLPSLSIPETSAVRKLRAAQAAEYEAIALFADRARAADHRFELSDENAPMVGELCRRLDGIPRAIELAAARASLLSVKALTEMLDDRFRLLAGGERTALRRQQTMRATIDWSYDLLTAPEQRLFERLSVFTGGCTLAGATAVCSPEETAHTFVLESLSSLVDKSLVVADLEGREPRYRLLESFREHAREKLVARNEQELVARRHAVACLALAERIERSYDPRPDAFGRTTGGRDFEQPVYEIEPELENARSAIDWALGAGEFSLASRLTCGFTRLWRMSRGDPQPRRWLEAVLGRLDEARELDVAAQAWGALSSLTFGVAKIDAAQRALSLYERHDDPYAKVATLYQLSAGLLHAGRIDEAVAANALALRTCQERGLRGTHRYAAALGMRASIAARRGRIDEARQFYTEALSLTTALGDALEATVLRHNMAELEFGDGNLERALEFAEAAALAAHGARAKRLEITARANTAAYQLALGDVDGARASAAEALTLARGAYSMDAAIAMQHLAAVAALRGDARAGARLRGYVDAWYRNQGCERDLTERRTYEILMAALRDRLSEAQIERLAAEGAELSEEQAALEALNVAVR